jgi:hypothetical protein
MVESLLNLVDRTQVEESTKLNMRDRCARHPPAAAPVPCPALERRDRGRAMPPITGRSHLRDLRQPVASTDAMRESPACVCNFRLLYAPAGCVGA